ncbi:phosphatidylinositol 4-kinase, putative [Ichthyophthirius multifiliis]|uniref:1-phosphatidylinositol 4-kinase n=1 Tax=Ichthyophthirius multifiliis TaxID=5932 RepID=G0R563_ICHMU|nr:phosphatidylinositol 4-kinase, putative [Ichthyophthirius multifiliis]EGR27387.1 phosphatidylinositol 4-kinase, putative [Ichthyophthirius multifiliis]|eukprot:XP_004024271.1 phosphatidylinositol 4-kinase, putative [Ichthyophthirius multifiliis]
MFQSEMFTTQMLIEYLFKKFFQEQIHEYLVNKLYTLSHKDLDFYLTQIIYLTIIKQSSKLDKFLCDLSKQNILFYYKTAWIIQAYSECCKLYTNEAWKIQIKKFQRQIEGEMVNSALVRIAEDYFVCFNTKKRAPYKIVIETIDLNEIKENIDFFEKLNKKQTFDQNNQDFIDQLNEIKYQFDSNEEKKEKYKGFAKWAKLKKKEIEQKTVYQKDSNKNIKEIEFPRTFEPWGELWEDQQQIIRESSPFSFMKSYKIRPIIVKGGDDLRQEYIAMQLIQKFSEIFKNANIPLYLRPYEIIVTSPNSGFIEFLPNTLSLDYIKKHVPNYNSLNDFYQITFGDYFEEAQKNFVESLAGYSLICYLLQIKDRHNGNILIDNVGHIIHIDFGFIFSIAPGGIKFETANFKLTNEYVSLMGGRNSDQFGYFKSLMVRGFIEIKKHINTFVCLLQIMMEQTNMQCFVDFDLATFRDRFKENSTDQGMTNGIFI